MYRVPLAEKRFQSMLAGALGRLVAPKQIYFMFAVIMVLLIAGTLMYSLPAEFIGLIALIALTICHFVDTFYYQKSDRRLMAIFQASPNPIIVFNKQCHLRNLNPAFTRVFGWTLDELQGNCSLFVSEVQKQLTLQKIGEMFRSGRPVAFETQFKTRAGIFRHVIVNAATVRGRGEIPFEAVINLTDITERKQIEARLRQANKLEAMGTLASGIAHDFNNILSPVIVYSELLRDDLPPQSPLQETVADILQAGQRAKDLVGQILAFSRQTNSAQKSLKIQPIVAEALKLLRSSMPATIEIRCELDADCGPVFADPTQIHRVVMNLATNAFHAMEETGGLLSVLLRQVRLDDAETRHTDLQPGNYVWLTVADTGTGIDKENMAKIFDPYFTTKDQHNGTGLGLSVVQGIIKSMGGDIQVFSETGRGTEFHIYWPMDGPEREAEKIDPRAPLRGGTERILLVDDEVSVTKMLRQVLERLGYQVTAHTSSTEALAAFEAEPEKYDLVLTDMTMPGMAGDELAQKIMAIRPSTPIIISTGYSRKLTSEVVKTIGIRGVLIKPATKGNLAAVIRAVLDDSGSP